MVRVVVKVEMEGVVKGVVIVVRVEVTGEVTGVMR